MKSKNYKSSFLFPKTNFLVGMGSVFNVQGQYFTFNYSHSGAIADLKALESDWGVVGQDLKISASNLEKTLKSKL